MGRRFAQIFLFFIFEKTLENKKSTLKPFGLAQYRASVVSHYIYFLRAKFWFMISLSPDLSPHNQPPKGSENIFICVHQRLSASHLL
jgi:hypothetical protein